MDNNLDKAEIREASSCSPTEATSPTKPQAAVASTIRDTKSLDFFGRLVDECIKNHDTCKVDKDLQSSLTDLKVIDCLQMEVVTALPDCKYFALSYVWGTNQQPCTIDGSLPQTIRDSITTVLYLGYRYLWVDRLCIDQNFNHKHQQLQQMGAIYATAEATLIAAAGDDPGYGLSGVSKNFCVMDTPAKRVSLETLVKNSKWSSRGWTLQEDFLSRRRLFFTNSGVQFICAQSSQSMVDESIVDWSWWHQARITTCSIFDQSEDFLQTYTVRELSYDSDVLKAAIGVLNTFRRRSPTWNHIWAVPYTKGRGSEDGVHMVLDWLAIDGSAIDGSAIDWLAIDRSEPNLERRPGYPSWSPLGWKFPFRIHIQTIPVDREDFRICIWKDGQYEDIGKSIPGIAIAETPESLKLQLTAYCMEMDVTEWQGLGRRSESSVQTLQVTAKTHLKIRFSLDTKFCDITARSPLLAVFCSFQDGKGFVLQYSEGYYERVGFFIVSKVQEEGQTPKNSYDVSSAWWDSIVAGSPYIKKRTILWG